VLTHAHEDHFGAIIDLWPKLKCPIYATPFSAALFEAKCARAQPAENPGHRGAARAAASISAVRRRVHSGRAFDSGIACAGDHTRRSAPCCTPATGRSIRRRSSGRRPTSEAARARRRRRAGADRRFHQCGARRALAVGSRGRQDHHRSWSNAPRAASPSPPLPPTSRAARGRGCRRAAGREVVVVGRAMERVVQVARETGYLDGVQNFRGADSTAICRPTRCWRCAPAARASRARRWRASPMTIIPR
jgi:ribonuclease J